MKRKCLQRSACPVARALDQIGDWWSLLIISQALAGVTRFSEFQSSLSVARNILASRLKKLTADGILTLSPDPSDHRQKRYTLTPKGESLYVVVAALRQWSQTHLPGPGASPGKKLTDTRHGKAVQPITITSHDGRPLGPRDISY